MTAAEEQKVDQAAEAFGEAMVNALAKLPSDERFKKACDNFIMSVQDDFHWKVIDGMAEQIEGFVRDMAQRAVDAMLRGQDDQVKRYLGLDGWTGRDCEHSVIRGTLFETGSIELRKRIVEANADLIRDARVADMEAQVASLVKQINDREAKINALEELLRYAA
ncbi:MULTISPECIES: hypothetical protein [unclassified Aurantimonas]|uniref:hypothetical protein n=1 Tax=unclassified Aurantimonas TaxID=2638230 RepID=UPI002E1734D6|nr:MULTISPECIES: hypothetical protein [unclassified Aurantimonas]MEC5289430.1 hypothetical protein [Aurantimonas sp. C2-3-R2]MEC5410510.1 hypothetical protein [Aurantimonas sp. C2-4-R8]